MHDAGSVPLLALPGPRVMPLGRLSTVSNVSPTAGHTLDFGPSRHDKVRALRHAPPATKMWSYSPGGSRMYDVSGSPQRRQRSPSSARGRSPGSGRQRPFVQAVSAGTASSPSKSRVAQPALRGSAARRATQAMPVLDSEEIAGAVVGTLRGGGAVVYGRKVRRQRHDVA
jgi:hypothetical protein